MANCFRRICLSASILTVLMLTGSASFAASDAAPDAQKKTAEQPASDNKAPEKDIEKMSIIEKRLAEAEAKLSLQEKEILTLSEQRERLILSLEEERKNNQEASASFREMKESKEARINELTAQLNKQQKSLTEIDEVIKKLSSDKEEINARCIGLKKEKEDLEAEALAARAMINDLGITGFVLKDRKYSAHEILGSAYVSSSLLGKLGTSRLIWMTGNPNEDFINEILLYNEAVELKIPLDDKALEHLTEKHRLNKKESGHLGKYLAIIGLINKKATKLKDEKFVEVLSVAYTGKDVNSRISLAPKLQQEAVKGRKFEEIQKEYPDKIIYASSRPHELGMWFKDLSDKLKAGEVSASWTESGYVILKASMRRPSYRPFEDTSPALNDKFSALVKKLLDELKKKNGLSK